MAELDEAVWLGRTLGGRYRLTRALGAGGGGVVYEASQLDLGRSVAIKILQADLARHGMQLERFRREARAVAKLGHPNIVQLIDFVDARGSEPAYLVLELVRGPSLHAVLEREPVLPPARAVAIALQVLAAIEAAHGAGIVHRDLKPANIVLADVPGVGEVAKLLDFGVAQVREELARLTAAGSVVGTPRYMSPEQASGGDVDARSDLWSLGVTLYRMVAGVFPFEGSRREIEVAIFGAPTPRIRPELGVPEALEDTIRRALAKAREDRWPSASAMADALRASLGPGASIATISDAGSRSREETLPERSPRVLPTVPMPRSSPAPAPRASVPEPRRWRRRLALLGGLALAGALTVVLLIVIAVAAYVLSPALRDRLFELAPSVPWPLVPAIQW